MINVIVFPTFVTCSIPSHLANSYQLRRSEKMEEVNPFKETFLLSIFNVGLPTVDVYSDIALTSRLYKSTVTVPDGMYVNGYWPVPLWKETGTKTKTVSHPIFATSLLIPFLINYVLGWRAWFFGDKNWRKKLTWIFALLGCYPQLVALRIICLFWKKPKKAMKKKKHLETTISLPALAYLELSTEPSSAQACRRTTSWMLTACQNVSLRRRRRRLTTRTRSLRWSATGRQRWLTVRTR